LGGRADGAILTAAATVIPEDVELTLRGAPGVHDVAVLGVEHPRMGALVAAVVEGTKPDVRTLREFAAAHLSLPQRPRAWYWIAELPRTASGKLDRAALAAAVTQGALTKL
jgi:acyl-CoA synthetase (AMP-forming)/AMP-acid ligase II